MGLVLDDDTGLIELSMLILIGKLGLSRIFAVGGGKTTVGLTYLAFDQFVDEFCLPNCYQFDYFNHHCFHYFGLIRRFRPLHYSYKGLTNLTYILNIIINK